MWSGSRVPPVGLDLDPRRLLASQGDEGAADAVGGGVAGGTAAFDGDPRPGDHAEVEQATALGAATGVREVPHAGRRAERDIGECPSGRGQGGSHRRDRQFSRRRRNRLAVRVEAGLTKPRGERLHLIGRQEVLLVLRDAVPLLRRDARAVGEELLHESMGAHDAERLASTGVGEPVARRSDGEEEPLRLEAVRQVSGSGRTELQCPGEGVGVHDDPLRAPVVEVLERVLPAFAVGVATRATEARREAAAGPDDEGGDGDERGEAEEGEAGIEHRNVRTNEHSVAAPRAVKVDPLAPPASAGLRSPRTRSPHTARSSPVSTPPTLARALGPVGLAATGICSMVGASIHIMPFLVQLAVPGIGPWVLPAFAFAALPAFLAALAYAALASAMPRAGGSYLFASRALHPSLGFVASFSQWVGLSIVIGAVAYVIPVFLSGVADGLGATGVATGFLSDAPRLLIALGLVWGFVGVNLQGLTAYERTLIPLMVLMFVLGAIVIVVGAGRTHADFAAAIVAQGGTVPAPRAAPFDRDTFVAAAAVLFSSFIGFDAIAQAGGEARDPARALPRAILLTFAVVAAFYFSFTAAVYHAVPWEFIAAMPADQTPTASGLLAPVLSAPWRAAITAGAAVALINDLPGMLLSVSRLMFAWARDGIFPAWAAGVHPTRQTPRAALLASGAMATVGVLLSFGARSFSKGVDIMVVAMLVNFLLMCLALVALPTRNPALAARQTILRTPRSRTLVGVGGVSVLSLFLAVHVRRELSATVSVWYERPLAVWAVVMAIGTVLHLVEYRRLLAREGDVTARFAALPEE